MKSSACKYGECGLCHHEGKVLMAGNKGIRCDCGCHPKVVKGAKPSRKTDEDSELQQVR